MRSSSTLEEQVGRYATQLAEASRALTVAEVRDRDEGRAMRSVRTRCRLLAAVASALVAALACATVLVVVALGGGSDSQQDDRLGGSEFPRRVSSDVLLISQISPRDFEVSVKRFDADTDAVRGELSAAGIDATVTLIPVSPSLVGRLTASATPSDDPTAVAQPNLTADSVRLDRSHSYEIVIGRPAGPDEAYVQAGSVFSPGEALHCSGIDQLGDPHDVEAALSARRIEISWRFMDIPGVQDGGPRLGTSEVRDSPPEGVVGGFAALDADTIVVFISPDEQVPDDRGQLFPKQNCE